MQNLCRDYIPELQKISLFNQIDHTEIEAMLNCLGAYIRDIEKDNYIILCGEDVDVVGIILSGKVQMIREDPWGNKSILVSMGKSELFGESFACGLNANATVSFTAATDAKIMFLTFSRIMRTCSMACKFHHQLVENMVALIAQKNLMLINKVDVLSKKTLREKIAAFLLQESGRNNSLYFEISFGRGQLAEYLCADRSALTRELNAMQEEGLIQYDKNTFRLLKNLEN